MTDKYNPRTKTEMIRYGILALIEERTDPMEYETLWWGRDWRRGEIRRLIDDNLMIQRVVALTLEIGSLWEDA